MPRRPSGSRAEHLTEARQEVEPGPPREEARGERLRVLLLSDAGGSDPEGGFGLAHRLAREFRRRGLRVLMAAPTEAGSPAVERLEGIPVRRVGPSWRRKGVVGRALTRTGARWAFGRWIKDLRERPPSFLHAHLSVPAVWLAARASRLLGVPWLLSAAGGGADEALRQARRSSAFAADLRSASAFAAPSEEALARVEPWSAPAVPRAVIPDGVEPSDQPLPEPPVVLNIGRQERGRGQGDLLRAFLAVHERVPRAVLVLAGEGPDRHRLWRIARTLPPETQAAVQWEGAPDEQRAAELLARARAAAFPGPAPFTGFLAARAMAAARPVVVAPSAGFPFHPIDGGNALVVPPGNSALLAEALLALLEDPALAERIGRAGQGEVLRHASWSEVGPSYLDLFLAATAAEPPEEAGG